jgi:hypothetical protein
MYEVSGVLVLQVGWKQQDTHSRAARGREAMSTSVPYLQLDALARGQGYSLDYKRGGDGRVVMSHVALVCPLHQTRLAHPKNVAAQSPPLLRPSQWLLLCRADNGTVPQVAQQDHLEAAEWSGA